MLVHLYFLTLMILFHFAYKISKILGIFCVFLLVCDAAPPFDGTIFLAPDIITSEDSTTYKSLSYTGTGMRTMYDRRSGWVDLEPFLFDASFSDSPSIEIQVNPEFGTGAEAKLEAERFAPVIGRLPKCLRLDVETVWIHKGDNPFGGGNNNLLIHTGQADDYLSSGILEETLVHEAAHTSLDASHAYAVEWVAAQEKDGEFISTYARDNPYREDIAESFLLYFALRYRADRVSKNLKEVVNQTIPNRLAYFDKQEFEYFEKVSGLWSVAKDLGQGWKNLNGWGCFYSLDNGWVYHLGMGWVYPAGKSPDSFWLFIPVLQKWLWSTTSQFPYLYNPDQNLWLYFHKQSEEVVYFHYTDGAWNRP